MPNSGIKHIASPNLQREDLSKLHIDNGPTRKEIIGEYSKSEKIISSPSSSVRDIHHTATNNHCFGVTEVITTFPSKDFTTLLAHKESTPSILKDANFSSSPLSSENGNPLRENVEYQLGADRPHL